MRSANPYTLENPPQTDSISSAKPALLQSIQRLARWLAVRHDRGHDAVVQPDCQQDTHAALGTGCDAMHSGRSLTFARYF